jgi:hypothetical protein
LTASLILSPPLERKLFRLCQDEGLIDPGDLRWRRQGRVDEEPSPDPATRSHLLTSLFLNPAVKVGPRYEIEVPLRTKLLRIDQEPDFAAGDTFDDMALLMSYCLATDPSLTPELAAYSEYKAAKEDAAPLLANMTDLRHIWSLRTSDNPVSIHPGLGRSYRQILPKMILRRK